MLLGELREREAIPEPGQPDHLRSTASSSRSATATSTASTSSGWTRTRSRARRRRRRAYFVERREYGPLIGTPVQVQRGRQGRWPSGPDGGGRRCPALVARRGRDRRAIETIEKDEIGGVNYAIEQAPAASAGSSTARRSGDPARDQSRERAAVATRSPSSRRATRSRSGARASSIERRRRRVVTFRPADGAGEGAARARHLPRLSRERARLARPRCASTRAGSGSSSPATRASRTPRAASSRRSSAP